MNVFVDADACPVVQDVLDLAQDRRVVLVSNRHHQIQYPGERVEHVMTGDRPDQVDFYIHSRVNPGDIVITDDLGLAALVLSRGGRVLRFRGEVPSEQTIGPRLEMRHQALRRRRGSSRAVSGPSAFDATDRQNFRTTLQQLLAEDPD